MIFKLGQRAIDTDDIQHITITTELDGFTTVDITYSTEPTGCKYLLSDPGVEAFVDWLESDVQHGLPIEYVYNTPF